MTLGTRLIGLNTNRRRLLGYSIRRFNFYETLGVKRDATEEEIKKEYVHD